MPTLLYATNMMLELSIIRGL